MNVTWDDFPEAMFTLPAGPGEPDLTISIAKVGGGIAGRAYTGQWQAAVTYGGREIYRTDDLYTNLAFTHLRVARHFAGFLSAGRTVDPAVAHRMDAWVCDDPDLL